MEDKNDLTNFIATGDLVEFVKMYKQHECLWNLKLDSYKRPEMRSIAISAIAKRFDVTNQYVKKKIHNLRTTYLHERKKIIKRYSLGSNDEITDFTSSLNWFKDMSFLEDVIIPRKKIQSKDKNIHKTYKDEDKTVDSKYTIELIDCPDNSWDNDNRQENPLHELTEPSETSLETSPSLDSFKSSPRRSKRKLQPITAAKIHTNNECSFKKKNSQSEDKFEYLDSFGKFIIEGIKTIPEQTNRDKLMQDILHLYFNAKLNSQDKEMNDNYC